MRTLSHYSQINYRNVKNLSTLSYKAAPFLKKSMVNLIMGNITNISR